MTPPDIAYSQQNYEGLYLIGVRLWPHSSEADCFALVLYNEVARGDRNRPLTRERRIVFFERPVAATAALRLGDANFRKYEKAPVDVSLVYDLPALKERIESGVRDEPPIIADTINELLDFVDATERTPPGGYKEVLAKLADFATFDTDLTQYFTDPSARERCQEALSWAIGVILLNAEIIA